MGLPEVVSRILIVRPSALGDVARTVPCLASLRRAFPSAELHWLVNRPFIDAIAHHPDLTRAIPFDRDKPAAAIGLANWLRKQQYDVVIDLQGLARSGFFTVATRAPYRVGFADAREKAHWAYHVKHEVDEPHAVDRMLGLLVAERIEPVLDMRLYVGQADQTWTDAFLQKEGLAPQRYALLAPTAAWGCKCWPIERYTELADRLLEGEVCAGDDGDGNERTIDAAKIIVACGPGEKEVARVKPLLDRLGERALCPRTSVGQLMGLIRGSGLVVCNDSAAAHLAVGFDRPLVCLMGPTDPDRVGPFRRHESVVQPDDITAADMQDYRHLGDDDALIARISVDQVLAVAQRELNTNHAQP